MAAKKKPAKAATVEQVEVPKTTKKSRKTGLIVFVVALLVIIGFILYRNRSWVIVATVDNKPIWRSVFEQRMISQIGAKTLDDIINEQLILNEAQKRGVTVSQSEVDSEISAIEKTLPQGTTLEDALKMQSMSMETLRQQMLLKLTIGKMLSNNVKVTEEEISKHISENREFMTATDEAGLAEEARATILNKKQNDEFQKLFSELQKKAKVSKFL